jgi:hypothetical protein
MEDSAMHPSASNVIQAILVGGPQSIPETSRVQTVSPLDEKIKLPHYGGYEHFERIGSPAGDTPGRQVIYRWTMRTEMAE